MLTLESCLPMSRVAFPACSVHWFIMKELISWPVPLPSPVGHLGPPCRFNPGTDCAALSGPLWAPDACGRHSCSEVLDVVPQLQWLFILVIVSHVSKFRAFWRQYSFSQQPFSSSVRMWLLCWVFCSLPSFGNYSWFLSTWHFLFTLFVLFSKHLSF